MSKESAAEKARLYRADPRTREAHLATKKRYYQRNREIIIEKELARQSANPERYRQYREKNKAVSRVNAKLWMKKRRDSDPAFRLLCNLRCRVYSAVKGTSKIANTITLLGCSPDELRTYLEKQFKVGMSWENYGPVWEIDHKRPCKSFDLTEPTQQKECFHWTNLQPLFVSENRKKSAKCLK